MSEKQKNLKTELLNRKEIFLSFHMKKYFYGKKKNLLDFVFSQDNGLIIENSRDPKIPTIIGVNPLFTINLNGQESQTNLRKIEKIIYKMQDKLLNLPIKVSFCGGMAGLIFYEYAYLIYKLKQDSLENSHYGFIHFYRDLIFLDKINMTAYIVSFYFPELDKSESQDALTRIEKISNELDQEYYQKKEKNFKKYTTSIEMDEKDLFERNFFHIKDEIFKGNLFQCVLSEKKEIKAELSPSELFNELSSQNKMPYCYFIQNDEEIYMGASPEFLLKCDPQNNLETAPIAGTRARSKNKQIDEKRGLELLKCPKENAEHLMLVDLSRNDLGQICEPKSIYVEKYKKLTKFDHVMHLVSVVRGVLSKKYSVIDAFEACFPAGTLSGAPKKEALKNIFKLESCNRRSYGGSLISFDFHKNFESIIAIRNLEYSQCKVSYRVGAGIVYGSTIEGEFKEIFNKAQTVENALGKFMKRKA